MHKIRYMRARRSLPPASFFFQLSAYRVHSVGVFPPIFFQYERGIDIFLRPFKYIHLAGLLTELADENAVAASTATPASASNAPESHSLVPTPPSPAEPNSSSPRKVICRHVRSARSFPILSERLRSQTLFSVTTAASFARSARIHSRHFLKAHATSSTVVVDSFVSTRERRCDMARLRARQCAKVSRKILRLVL